MVTCSGILDGDRLRVSTTIQRYIFSVNQCGNAPILAQALVLDVLECVDFAPRAPNINPRIFVDTPQHLVARPFNASDLNNSSSTSYTFSPTMMLIALPFTSHFIVSS